MKSKIREFEAPYKDKILCISAYELINALVENKIEKVHAIIIVDNLLNNHKVILRSVTIPNLLFQQIHSRKTKGKPEIHLQMPRKHYSAFKILMKKLEGYQLFTITMNHEGKLGSINSAMKKLTKCG